jgi:hypothetical protein
MANNPLPRALIQSKSCAVTRVVPRVGCGGLRRPYFGRTREDVPQPRRRPCRQAIFVG